MLTIAIIAGVLLGGAWGDGLFGAAVGGALAWLIVRSVRHDATIAELQRALLGVRRGGPAAPAASSSPREMDRETVRTGKEHEPGPEGDAEGRLEPAVRPMGPDAPGSPARSAGAAMPAARAASMQLDPEGAPVSSAVPEVAIAASARGPGIAAVPVVPPAAPRDWLAPVKAWLFGGNTIVKLGVAILFIGLAFLAKFASEHVQMPIEMRLAVIAAAALGLLAFGWRLRKSRAAYAQVLQGAAVAVLFLTLFVAFRTYQVIPGLAAFALMVGVAALAAALAVLQDARALAVIGALGGFATPLLVSTGGGNPVALFSYYLALDLGIAAVAWFKHWRTLNLIGFVATFGVATAWGVLDYRAERYAGSQAFLIAFFLLFVLVGLLPARRLAAATAGSPEAGLPSAPAAAWINGSLLFGLPTIAYALQMGMVRQLPFGAALSALAMAAFYVMLALWLRRRGEFALVSEASLAIAVVFLTLVIPFALDAHSTAGAWALEGAGLVWLGFRQSRRLARGFGYALLLLAGPTLLWAMDRHGPPQVIFNGYLFNGLMVVAGALLAAFFVRRGAAAAQAMRGEALAEPVLVGWATLAALAAAAVQIDRFVVSPCSLAAWLVTGSAIALCATALVARWRWPTPAWPALLHAVLLVLATFDAVVDLRQPLAEGGAWAWPVALATHLVVLRWAAPHWGAWAGHAVHVVGVLVLATLGALGGRALTQALGDAHSAWAWLGWLVAPALLLVALLRPSLAQRWPLSAAPRAYGLWAAGVLAIALWGWTLLANALSNGAARPLPHLPLLNPLDVGVGVALVGVWMWLNSAPVREKWTVPHWLTPAAMGFAGFVWLNAILIRAFHHYGDVPYRLQAWAHSLPVHTGITLLWTGTALALMWWAARRVQRAPWVVGACLLAAVVLKLMLVDLSGSGTVTRIVSFVGVGVLMMVIGYVAPLPAKGSAQVSADRRSGEASDAKA